MNNFRKGIGGRRGRHGWGRETLLVLALAAGLALSAGEARAGGGKADDRGSAAARSQIEDLVVCYARGTDALGRAVNAIGGQPLDSTVNLADPGFAEGLAYYRRCFADDFSFTLKVDGVPTVTVPDPATVTPDTDAALQWANFVNNAFRGPGYQSTQHHMGSISTQARGNRGSAVSYLIALHVYGPTSDRSGVNMVGGTYTDEVVRRRGVWQIGKRTLDITSSVDLPASP